MENKFQMVAKTFQGLEEVLRDELIDLGAENVELGLRMVSFEGDNEILYKANLCCRTALRILKPIVKFTADSTDELYDKVRELEWEQFMTPDSTFSIDSTVNGDDFTHSKYVTYRVKDGIVDHFSDSVGRRPSIRLSGADLQFNVHIAGNRVTISLDSSGEPLYKRGYRVAQTEAPINEVLAAGIIMKTGWRGDSDFIDPMCGSGTFLIEAALIAANINPGIYRENFAFEKWADFDKDLFEEIYNDDSAERDFAYKIYGGDIDPDAVAAAWKNVKSARVEDMIEIECKPVAEWEDVAPEGILVTNPPYGERLKPLDIKQLYRGIGTVLKKNFQGWHAWIIGYQDEHFAEIGLKPSVKIPLYNGALECSLREYVMFDGKYSEFRADGGSVANESVRKEQTQGPKKVRHISDDDWEKEANKFNRAKGMGDDKKKKKSFTRDDSKHTSAYPVAKRGAVRDDDDDFTSEGNWNSRRENRDHNNRGFNNNNRDNRDYRDSRDNREGRNFNNDRKPFNRDNRDRRDSRDSREGRNFNNDRKPFNRDNRDRRDSRDNREGRDNRDRRPGQGINYNPANSAKPRLPESSATVINPVHMRSRKPRKSEESED